LENYGGGVIKFIVGLKKKDAEDMKKYFKDIAKKWDVRANETDRDRRNKGYEFLKHIEKITDASGESGTLKRRKKIQI